MPNWMVHGYYYRLFKHEEYLAANPKAAENEAMANSLAMMGKM